ncbi:tRNA (adenosine(37)-N6)-dimethylallyltransferase MiaA [Eggerthia catenaformis]|uniref:tRNA (adenosine(37)-N6)-dimethylallyltransferase MiaA n=1 Tax=Eggerthia catenaformis TaxID=31973 RepID=UPI00248DD098|nr:tRNA (adenosine(37)-N6)-dimethylallyltransferase MiaA [Eggerthia catenaformis]
MKKVIVIVGPTAVGKTKMGVRLAQKYNGEVISGDSMQIYKRMNIGTAKVTKEEMEGIVHHCIDMKEPNETYSVSQFQKTVRDLIDNIISRNKVPIIVGGTGLYIKAVLYDYHFDQSKRLFDKDKYKDYTNHQLYDYLKIIDPTSAKTIHINNRRRILRAIEIYETTGIKKSENEEKQSHQMIYDAYLLGLSIHRELLYKRINQRVDQMFLLGLKEEVDYLISRGCTKDLQSMKAIGYKEWFTDDNLETIKEKIKIHSRQYAKRQYTWFNNQMPVKWYMIDEKGFEDSLEDIERDVNEWMEL